MASTKVSDYILQRLREWDVDHVFAYAGDGINGLLAAWGRAGNKPKFIQARHEEMAAFQAVGYAKFSGRVGVCAATSGPGAIHLLNGLYDAKLDHVPVVALVGQTNRSAMGGSYQQEVDLQNLFKDVASDFCETATVPEQLPNLIDRAMRTAYARRTVTAVILPADVQELDYTPPTHAFKMVPSSLGLSRYAPVPGDEDLQRAADVLNAGEKVAVLIGQGARGARDEVERLADVLGAGVAKALLGKDSLPDDLPYVTGSIGLLGTRPSYDLMQRCDTLLVIGSSFPYSQFLPELDQARAVQIDIDPHMIGLRYPFEVNLVGDARETLQRLLPRLHRKENRGWRNEGEENVTRWWEVMQRRAAVDADPINPEYVVHALDGKLPDDVILTADSGSAANWYARHLRLRGRMRGSLSGTLATMGPGVPYAIGAKFAHSDRPAIALVGDGAMQMNGMMEMVTAAKYHHEWSDPRLIVAVLNNGDLNQVTWEMRAMSGAPQFEESQHLPDLPYAEIAKHMGLDGVRVEKPKHVEAAWDRALAADRPFVIDFRTDPAVPPIPPHASLDQIAAAASAVLQGDSDRGSMIKQGLKAKVQEMLPGSRHRADRPGAGKHDSADDNK
ncbi:thiamine pyrophosphate-requiring protein [Streptomyces microflavus]|uniref:Thiamine pyrophosphate-requiring protein n=1 Tax=Streptomyces microflavus TaxID=1919 RepID=A0A7J0D5D0_STRMI|nr:MULTISPECIES: thiamine pyrophosphate-requiring protein [Streptomyces]MDX2982234.1 thiamine pyrophosphate-requiring protein [Streptomyces sp. NRRL_B-2249]GFN09951.1 thiamine pyrophosphate-requiring protein [Streptomyces microflavus]GGX92950.1 thiamine pyrophosphate-requiring protein [Streptomyces microflavus]